MAVPNSGVPSRGGGQSRPILVSGATGGSAYEEYDEEESDGLREILAMPLPGWSVRSSTCRC